MEAAISLMGVALTTLAMVLAYIWRTNGRIFEGLKSLQEGLKSLQEGLKTLQEGQKALQEGLQEGLQILATGQARIIKIIEDADRRRAEDTKFLAELIARISRP